MMIDLIAIALLLKATEMTEVHVAVLLTDSLIVCSSVVRLAVCTAVVSRSFK